MAALLSCEHPLMDSEHRVVLTWVQEGARCLQEVRPTEECLYVVDVLAQLARSHFKNEQTEMRACGYPDWSIHAQDHELLLAQLAQTRQSIVNAATGAAHWPAHKRWRLGCNRTSLAMIGAMRSGCTRANPSESVPLSLTY